MIKNERENRSTFPSSLSATVRFEKVRQRRTLWATLFDTVQKLFLRYGHRKSVTYRGLRVQGVAGFLWSHHFSWCFWKAVPSNGGWSFGKVSDHDEPFSAIDSFSEEQIIKSLASDTINKMCIFVTHRFNNICLADQILVLKDAQLIENGTHAQLMATNGLYARLYHAQADAFFTLSQSEVQEEWIFQTPDSTLFHIMRENWQAMPLDSHSASGAACWRYPPSPHKRRISFCGYTFCERFWPWPTHRWSWSFSFWASCSASIFKSRSTLAFAASSSRISSRERRYSA